MRHSGEPGAFGEVALLRLLSRRRGLVEGLRQHGQRTGWTRREEPLVAAVSHASSSTAAQQPAATPPFGMCAVPLTLTHSNAGQRQDQIRCCLRRPPSPPRPLSATKASSGRRVMICSARCFLGNTLRLRRPRRRQIGHRSLVAVPPQLVKLARAID